jgi:hypothetical protein
MEKTTVINPKNIKATEIKPTFTLIFGGGGVGLKHTELDIFDLLVEKYGEEGAKDKVFLFKGIQHCMFPAQSPQETYLKLSSLDQVELLDAINTTLDASIINQKQLSALRTIMKGHVYRINDNYWRLF